MAAYVVTGVLVIAKNADGSDLYLYQDSELPDSVDAASIKRLVSLGLVSKVAGASGPAKPAAESN